MLIFGVVARGSNILGEYGTTAEDYADQIIPILARNLNPGTRLVPMDGPMCAVMNKKINGEMISFAAVIESQEERDEAFNYLDSLASFFEKESGNAKMRSEMNSFISRQMKVLMVDTVKSGKNK